MQHVRLDLGVQPRVRVAVGGEPLDHGFGVGVVALEDRQRRAPHRRPPRVARQTEALRERLMRVDLGPHGGEVAALEVVEHEPVARLQFALGVAPLDRQREHLVRGGEPLLEVLRLHSAAWRASSASSLSSGPASATASSPAPFAASGVTRNRSRSPAGRAAGHATGVECQRLLEQRDRLAVDGDDRHAQAAEAERSPREHLRVSVRELRGVPERVTRRLARTQLRLAERQYSSARRPSSAPSSARSHRLAASSYASAAIASRAAASALSAAPGASAWSWWWACSASVRPARLGECAVRADAAGEAQLVVERLADQRVRECVSARALLADQMRPRRLLDRGQRVLAQHRLHAPRDRIRGRRRRRRRARGRSPEPAVRAGGRSRL